MNVLIFGFYTLHVAFDGTVKMYSTKGKSWTHNSDASGAGYSSHDSIDAALKLAKEWGIFIWNHNDRLRLVHEYNLSREFVTDFLGYVWPLSNGQMKGETYEEWTRRCVRGQ